MADNNNNNSYTVTPESVGLGRNTNPFTMDLTRDPTSNVSTDTPDGYQKVFDESIGGGINFKKNEDTSTLNIEASKEVPLVRSNIFNLDANVRGGAWESTSSKDVYIVNESGKKIGASVKGNLVLDEEGTAILRGRLDKDFTTVDMEELTPLGNYKGQDGKIYTNWDLMLDVGRLGIDFGKKALTLTLGNNGKLSVNPEKVGYEYGIKFNKGGTPMMEKQMEMFEDGGLKDEGGMIDKESGNDVPIGSTRKEVRDDIPAKLSEGEFVFPADVVRFIGLEKLMTIRQKAKMGLQRMEEMGQMGNSDEATMPDDMPFGMSDLIVMSPEGKEVEMAEGGVIHAATGVNVTPSNNPTMTNVQRVNNTGSTYTPYTTGASVVPLPTQPVPTKPVVTASGPPKFPEVMGDAAVTMRQYKNAAGYVMMIPHIGDKPMYPVPEGYVLVAEDGTTPDIPPATGETTPEETVKPEEFDYGGEVDKFGNPVGSSSNVSMENMSVKSFNILGDLATKALDYKGPFAMIVNTWGKATIAKQDEIVSKDLDAVQKSFTVSDGTYGNFGPGVNEFGEVGSGGVDGTPNADGTVGTSLGEFGGLGAKVTGPGTKNPNVLSETSYAKTPTVTTNASKAIADKIAKDKKDKADKAIIALAEKAIADKVAKDKEFNAMESATYSDNSPATGGFTGYSGDYGGPDNDPSGFGGTGGYGMFNQGGLAGKKSKPKKKPTKRYKKGGLATSKK